MKVFQTILLIVFGTLIVLAVLMFSGIIDIGGAESQLVQEPVTMWGTMKSENIKIIVDNVKQAGDNFNITYVQKDARTFEEDLIDALASGVGPDLILAPHTLLLKQRDKFLPLPYTAIPERLYRDSFVEATEILLSADHTLGMPLYLDPIVMYWNRDMFAGAGIASAPATWMDVQLLPSKLTVLDDKGNISRAAVAMGGINNVAHFKEILVSQILQTGNPLVLRTRDVGPEGKAIVSSSVVLAGDNGAESVLRFYVQFADPALKKYSWNSAMPNSLEGFVGGKLGVYLGLASDLSTIRARNPHLDFDVAELPRIQVGGRRATYADVYGLSILKSSKSSSAAFAVAFRMAMGASATEFAKIANLPPARRDLVATLPSDPLFVPAYSSAVVAGAWEDPDAVVSRNIFADMVESVTIGRSDVRSAVTAAELRLSDLLKKK